MCSLGQRREKVSENWNTLGMPVECGKRSARLKESLSDVRNRIELTRVMCAMNRMYDEDRGNACAVNVNSWLNRSVYQNRDTATKGVTRTGGLVGFGGDILFAFNKDGKKYGEYMNIGGDAADTDVTRTKGRECLQETEM